MSLWVAISTQRPIDTSLDRSHLIEQQLALGKYNPSRCSITFMRMQTRSAADGHLTVRDDVIEEVRAHWGQNTITGTVREIPEMEMFYTESRLNSYTIMLITPNSSAGYPADHFMFVESFDIFLLPSICISR